MSNSRRRWSLRRAQSLPALATDAADVDAGDIEAAAAIAGTPRRTTTFLSRSFATGNNADGGANNGDGVPSLGDIQGGELEAPPPPRRRSTSVAPGVTVVEDMETNNFSVVYDDFLLDQLEDAFGVDFRRSFGALLVDAEAATVACTESSCSEGEGDEENNATPDDDGEGGDPSATTNDRPRRRSTATAQGVSMLDPDTGLPIATPVEMEMEEDGGGCIDCCSKLFVGVLALLCSVGAIMFLIFIIVSAPY